MSSSTLTPCDDTQCRGRGMYEPKYGTHDRLEEFTREHCAFIEDQMADNVHLKVVARFHQTYADGGSSLGEPEDGEGGGSGGV